MLKQHRRHLLKLQDFLIVKDVEMDAHALIYVKTSLDLMANAREIGFVLPEVPNVTSQGLNMIHVFQPA